MLSQRISCMESDIFFQRNEEESDGLEAKGIGEVMFYEQWL